MYKTRKSQQTLALAARQASGLDVARQIVEAGLYGSLALLVLVLLLIGGRI